MISKLSVLIPVYNEELYVENVLKELEKIELPQSLKMEIIVVDDGSTDQTRRILKGRQPSDALKIIYLDKNFGKGAAIREGLRHVTGEVVIIQDADLEYSTADYPTLIEPFLKKDARAVYGSRFLGNIEGMRPLYRMFNLFIRSLVNLLFHARLTDEATAYKLVKTDLLRSLNLESQRFEVCPEITAKLLKRGVEIHEVPINYRARNHKQGKKIGWRDAFSAVITLLKYRWTAPSA